MLAVFSFSFNSGYLYQVVVRIPLRFARVIRPGSGWRLGRAYGARPFNLHNLVLRESLRPDRDRARGLRPHGRGHRPVQPIGI